MNISLFKRLSLWSLIGFLTLSALIAIVTLIGGDFGETQIKVILTTLTISGASICAMACSAFIERRGGSVIGGIGILCAAAAAGLSIGGIWGESGNEAYWKTSITAIIVAVALAHSLLLFYPVLPPGYRWSQWFVAVSGAALATMILVAVWGEVSGDDYYRIMGVVAVLVVLSSLLVPICAKLGAGAQREAADLVLTRREGGVYSDASGQLYRVTKV